MIQPFTPLLTSIGAIIFVGAMLWSVFARRNLYGPILAGGIIVVIGLVMEFKSYLFAGLLTAGIAWYWYSKVRRGQ